jgi:RNA polymerase sigma-32 factor
MDRARSLQKEELSTCSTRHSHKRWYLVRKGLGKEDFMIEHQASSVEFSESNDSLEKYVRAISKFPLLSREEEVELATRYRDHKDPKIAHKLITSNLRFVVKIALEYRFYGVKVLDLVQEGNVGLITAINKFNPDKGYRLISYAVWWIRACIQNFVMKTWSLVRIGTTETQRKLFYKIRKIRTEMESDHENEDQYELLANDLDVSKEDIVEMQNRVGFRDVSLDSPFDDADDASPLDLLRSKFPDQEEILGRDQERRVRSAAVQEALRTLSEREAFVITHRIMASEPLTLQEIGTRFRVSRERVRQIERQALKKLKAELSKGDNEEKLSVVALASAQSARAAQSPERSWSADLRTA